MNGLVPCNNSKKSYISRMQQKPHSEMTREFARNEFHRERLEYNEERDW